MDRIDPRSGLFVNCMDCRHLDTDTLYTCVAYPNGIPVPILAGDIQHDHPLVGDKGIQFEATTVLATTLDSENTDIISLLSEHYPKGVDAVLGIPRVDGNQVSGLFRSRYTVVSYRFDNAFLTWEEWDKSKSASFLRGFYLPDLSAYLPEAYAMGVVDAAISQDRRIDTASPRSDSANLTKGTVALTPQLRQLARKIRLKHKGKNDTGSNL